MKTATRLSMAKDFRPEKAIHESWRIPAGTTNTSRPYIRMCTSWYASTVKKQATPLDQKTNIGKGSRGLDKEEHRWQRIERPQLESCQGVVCVTQRDKYRLHTHAFRWHPGATAPQLVLACAQLGAEHEGIDQKLADDRTLAARSILCWTALCSRPMLHAREPAALDGSVGSRPVPKATCLESLSISAAPRGVIEPPGAAAAEIEPAARP